MNKKEINKIKAELKRRIAKGEIHPMILYKGIEFSYNSRRFDGRKNVFTAGIVIKGLYQTKEI